MCKVLVQLLLACELDDFVYCEATWSSIPTSTGWDTSRTQGNPLLSPHIFCQVAMLVRNCLILSRKGLGAGLQIVGLAVVDPHGHEVHTGL